MSSPAVSGMRDAPVAPARPVESGSAIFGPAASRRMPLIALWLLLALAVLLALGHGAVAIAPGQTLAILADLVGIHLPWTYDISQRGVLLELRAPRVVLGVAVGAALAVTGATMQGLFRNPLADPGLIGVSSGAVLGAVCWIVLGASMPALPLAKAGVFALPVAAFMGGLIVTWLVYRVGQTRIGIDISTLLLAGIAINAIAMAAIGLLTYIANDTQLRTLTFWSMGSLAAVSWTQAGIVCVLVAAAMAYALTAARALDAMLLGESEAMHLGYPLESIKRSLIVCVALAVGAAVAFAGTIGFVGLIVPHLLRLWIGAGHRLLLPASALAGAALLVFTDLLSRTLVAPAELPIGIITALLGGPFFLWLLVRNRKRVFM